MVVSKSKLMSLPSAPALVTKAPLAVAIIAKDSAGTIAKCLDSIVPHVQQVVVCVDSQTKDDTARVSKRHGAKVYQGLIVSEPHECEKHGRVLAQDFAKARDWSFSKLDPAIPWRMWIDADDIVRGADKLHKLLTSAPDDLAGVWLPYHYSTANDDGNSTSTLFDRERIVRTAMPWRWQHRVHEVIVPADGNIIEHLNWIRTDDVSIWHQGTGHDTAGSAHRNILLLEIELEQDPSNARSLFYLGNQHFALHDFVDAIYWWQQSTKSNNPYQLWQTYLYMSMAYEQLGQLTLSAQAAYQAMETAPYHPDPCYCLARLAMLRGDTPRCEFWTKLGDSLQEPPAFAFRNPLDRTFNSRVTLGNAYRNNGNITKARIQFEQAHATVATAELQQSIVEFRQLEHDSVLADGYARVLQDAPDANLSIPPNVWRFGRIRDIAVPRLLAARPNTQPRLIMWCNRSIEPWSPASLNTTGIGGSETAVIEVAKRFAADGYRVDVYNEPDFMEGEYEGVGYWGLSRLHPQEACEVFVSWRNPAAHPSALGLNPRMSLLWCHDLNKGPDDQQHFHQWSKVLGVSRWHASYLSEVYGLQPDAVDYAPNGIELVRFSGAVKKVPFRCVYASSPDRGLARLLRMWPAILAKEPAAELHIAYGWENIDKFIAMGHADLAKVKQEILDLLKDAKRVVWRGRMPQNELAKLYQESYLWLYPTSFLEVSCISAMEAMASGCTPVTSAAGALPETITDAGLIVPGNTYTHAWQEFFIHVANGAICDRTLRQDYAAKGQQRVEELTWDKAYERWKLLTMPSSELAQVEALA